MKNKTISTLVLFLLSISATGQIDVSSEPCDCLYTYKEKTNDRFTSEVARSLEPSKIGIGSSTGIEVKASVAHVGEFYTIHLFYAGDLGCISSESHARFSFADGTEVDLEHTGNEDCDDILHFNGKVFDELGSFRTLSIDKIVLYGTENNNDLYIEVGTYFVDAFNCCIF